MSTLIACAVFDAKADCFNRPFFVPTSGLAVRSFTDEVNRRDNSNPMFVHPNDFSLWIVGSYEEHSGLLEAKVPPTLLVQATSVLNSEE